MRFYHPISTRCIFNADTFLFLALHPLQSQSRLGKFIVPLPINFTLVIVTLFLSLPIYIYIYIYLSLLLPWISSSYMTFLSPTSSSWPLNLVKNKFIIKAMNRSPLLYYISDSLFSLVFWTFLNILAYLDCLGHLDSSSDFQFLQSFGKAFRGPC